MNRELLLAWCAEVAAGFRGHEHTLVDEVRLKRDRDARLAQYVIEELGRRRDSATAEIVEHIDKLQAGMGDAA